MLKKVDWHARLLLSASDRVSSEFSADQDIFKLASAGWHCVTKGSIVQRASLFLFFNDLSRLVKFRSERCLSTVFSGYRLF